MKTIRCSHLPRIFACPASAKAPEIPIGGGDAGGPADLGSAVHAVMADYITGDLPLQEYDLSTYQRRFSLAEIDDLRWLSWRAKRMWDELAEELKVVSVEHQMRWELPDGLAPGMGVIIQGTADLVLEVYAEEPVLAILDWKTGHVDRDYANQAMGYLWLAYRFVRDIRPGQRYPALGKIITAWVRSGEIDVRYVTADDMLKWELLLHQRLCGITYAPGECCEFCPLKRECSAKQQLVRATMNEMAPFAGNEPISPEKIVSLYPRSKLLEKALKNYKSLLREMVKESGSVSLGDGRELYLDDRSRDTIYYIQGMEAIAEAVGKTVPEVNADLQDIITVKKKGLLDYVAKPAPKKEKGKAREDLMEALGEADAVETLEYTQFATRKEKSNG